MSLEFDWDNVLKIQSEVMVHLNDCLKNIAGGSFIIEHLDLGKKVPQVVIRDIQNVQFYNLRDETSCADDCQIEASVEFDSKSLKIIISGEIRINYPTIKFITLPVKIEIRQVHIHALFTLVSLRGKVPPELYLSMKKHGPESHVFELEFDSQIGDPSNSCLCNVEKVDIFIRDTLYNLIDSLLLYPNLLRIK